MLKIFLISLFASVAFAVPNKCDEATEACIADDPGIMPENAEELDAYCVSQLKIFQCLLEARSQCEKNTRQDSMYRESIFLLKHFCDRESELYNNLVLALPCIKQEIVEKRNFTCVHMYHQESTLEKFEKFLNNAGITDVNKDHDCFDTYFFDACMVGSHGALCGEVARDVALDIAQLKLEAGSEECNVKIKGKQTYAAMAPEMEILYLESQAVLENIEDTSEEK